MMKFPSFLQCTLALCASLALGGPKPGLALDVQSPNGRLVLTFEVKDAGGAHACPCYRVAYEGRTVLADSRLGLELEGGPLDHGLAVVNSTRSQRDLTWKPVCGERDSVRDHYNELRVDLRETGSPHRILQVVFRAYDEGAAFCYTLPAQEALKDFTIVAEKTSFRFLGDHTTWAVYAAQGNYDGSEVPLSKVRPGVERPLTVRIADDLYAAITEARLVDYARMKLRPAKGQAHTLEAFLDAERGKSGAVTGAAPFTSPWRVLMVAESPGKLLEQNYLVLNLNDPCALKNTSWIKPGKVIREVSLTTAGGKACVDFCLRHGLQYVEYDAGWYGHEYDPNADARDVHLDPKRNPDPTSLDLHEVIRYADSKGIGVILYVNHLALEKQLDEILPLYQKWGVKGVKYGFVNVGSQHWTRWLHEAIRKAAACRLMVDIHDEFRSTGFQRTYPNLMTVEGILGNEGFPTPVHNATLPFTRFLTGPGDYTFCWQIPRLKPTHAHQLALSTIFFSPWQFLYWYDRPSMVREERALEYWRHLPTVWDETRVLKGEIGREASVARRKGDAWCVGTIRAVGRGPIEIPLSFLEPGRKYSATIYSDGNPLDPASKEVKIETMAVDSTTMLKADIPANGGQAVRIVPDGGTGGDQQAQKTGAMTGPSQPDPTQVPGVVIDHSPKSSGIYIGSPSIAILANGDYVASHDLFGPKTTEHERAITRVFRSSDKGKTWTPAADIRGQFWSTLFVRRGDLYILGTYSHYGNAVIRRSTDGGRTWTEPKDAASGLLLSGRYHCAPVPVVEHGGRLWRAMEDTANPRRWGLPFRAMMLSAPVDADLLRAESWTCTNRLPSDPAWLDGKFNGWLEGNAVVTPEGRIVDVLRVDCPEGGKAAIVGVAENGRSATFDPATAFIDFPGGAKKFTIRYEPESKRYWSLTDYVPPKHRGRGAGGVRNTLALTNSADLRRWTVNSILLYHPDVSRHGFQYPDWQFDGEDMIAAVRTAYDDGLGGAHNAHDANYLTFHRVRGFRRLTLADSVVRPDTLGIDGNKGGNARVVLVGDSITGLSWNYAAGFAHQIQWALKSVYPDCKPDLVALGGSGQGIASWLGVEKRSRQEEFFLDVPGIGVKSGLDRPADVVVIMLGMNDVLAPYVADTPASLNAWTENYRTLIRAIRQRVKPSVVALATVTMNTEDPRSPKNRMIDQLNRRLATLAEESGCRVLRTGEAVREVLQQGRRIRPDFHVTYDFVHPNEAGHLAIAIAMLRGLGEEAAAQRLVDQRLALVFKKAAERQPPLSCQWSPVPGSLASDRQGFRVRYWWNASPAPANGSLRVSLAGTGWDVQPDHCQAAEGEFLVTGVPERRVNTLKLTGSNGRQSAVCEVKIPAPWLVAAKMVQPMWSNMTFDAAKAHTPIDDAIARGEDFLAAKTAPGKGKPLSWRRYFASVDYTGLDSPGSVDFSAVTHAENFEGGYAARWIYSPRERPVRVALGVQAFAGALHLAVALNGQELYAGHITAEPGKRKQIEARLRQGWNTLVFKANHCTWQWQCAVDLAPVGDDSLDDLRYSTLPQPAAK